MKIAMIVPYPIYPPDEGGRSRAYNLLKHLAPAHELVLLTPRSPGNALLDLLAAVYETTPPGRRYQIVWPGLLRRAPAILRKERPDVILVEYPWPGLHGAFLARRLGVPLVLDAPNVEGERFRSTGAWYWRGVALYERLIASLASRVFAVSDEDRERFIRSGVRAEKIQIVPNGVDPAAFHPDPVAAEAVRSELAIGDGTKLLLFFGQLDYAPNREALEMIWRELLPRLDRRDLDYRLVIAGKGDHAGLASQYHHPRALFTGVVPAMAPYINAADTVLVPVLSGGGTRLKILESVACGTPVVSTVTGAEGIDRAACGPLLIVEDSWDGFAARLAEPRGAKRAAAPPPAFLDAYAWPNLVRRIEWPALGRDL